MVMVGGPADGRTFTLAADEPPMQWRVVIEQSVTLFPCDPLDFSVPPVADYRLLLEQGWPSRTDDGAYRYGYVSTPAAPHYGQSRPTPMLDELAGMTRDPSPAAYPDGRAHLLACRTRHSLRRDDRLTPAERAAVDEITLEHVRAALRERHRPA